MHNYFRKRKRKYRCPDPFMHEVAYLYAQALADLGVVVSVSCQ